MKIIIETYNRIRRSVSPASKYDLDWRTDELKASLQRIERRLNILPEGQKNSGQDIERYTMAQTKNGYMLTFSNDMVIGKHLREIGSFQEEDIDRAVDFLEKGGYSVSRGIFLDIGANIGTHTVYALQHGFENAICIEADPDNFLVLKVNQLLNDLDSRCMNVNAAASLTSCEVEIELSPTNYGDHRISIAKPNKNVHNEQNWSRKKIKSDTLDNILKSLNISIFEIGLAWIDTQGHEGHVLGGAKSLMESSVPFAVEFWPYGLERSGGWGHLRSILEQSYHDIFDLKRSIECGELVKVSVGDLDVLYDRLVDAESVHDSPATDLLLARKV
jgi:FkbM family methyltransferase